MSRFDQEVFQAIEKPGDALPHGRIEITLRVPELRRKATIPIERNPAVMLRIDLRAGLDVIVLLPAEVVRMAAMAKTTCFITKTSRLTRPSASRLI